MSLVLEAGFIAAAIPALLPGASGRPATTVADDDPRFSREPAPRARAERRREADVSA